MPIDLKIAPETPPGFGHVIDQFEFPSELARKSGVIERLLGHLRSRGLFCDSEDEIQARLCLDEALINAIRHGNKLDPNKKVSVTLYLDDVQWGLRVEDEGSGFDPGELPDPDDPESLLLEHGRGVLILMNFMDELCYYDQGNRLLMMRSLRNQPESQGTNP